MKPLHLLCAGLALLLAFGACSRGRSYPDYSVSSGFTLDSLDACNPQVVENLEVLCRVWGYAKYHHPVFADSTVNIDYELFDLLPKVAKADPETRNRVLADWVDGLGSYDTAPQKYDSLPANRLNDYQTDLGWTRDTVTLGSVLSRRLTDLRYADRSRGNRYATKCFYEQYNSETRNVGFAGETPYKEIIHPDCGYRLMAVFRLWNMVEYFFPYKFLTDKPWDDVLPEYIGRMIALSDGSYRRTMWRMIAEMNESHADWNAMQPVFGRYRVPLETVWAEGKIVVAKPDTETGAAFRPGDEIVAVNGRPVEYYKAQVRIYLPCSNETRVCDQTADAILRSERNTSLRIRFRRDGVLRDTLAGTSRFLEHDSLWEYETGDLGGGIAYINPKSYTAKDEKLLATLVKRGKGLIVDLRHYPRSSDFSRFIDAYVIKESTLFAAKCQCYTYPNLLLPGTFASSADPEPVWSRPYRSTLPIVVLVNGWTQSSGETHVQWLQICSDVVVVGSQSAGANGNISSIILPGGVRTGFSGLGWYYSDGVTVQRTGVRIDVPVHATVEGLKAGRDEILEKALEIIRTGACDPEAER